MIDKQLLCNKIKTLNITKEMVFEKNEIYIVKEKEAFSIIYDIIKDKNITIHDDLIPYINELFTLYSSVDKEIGKKIYKKKCENTFKIMEGNQFKVRKKKLAKLITFILIDLVILEKI